MNPATLRAETTDPDIIQEWTETRGGIPARDMNDPSELKIVFDEESTDMSNLEKISWSEFFELFEENECKFYYEPDDEAMGEEDASTDESEDTQKVLSQDYRIEKNAR